MNFRTEIGYNFIFKIFNQLQPEAKVYDIDDLNFHMLGITTT